jgi:hypothetical protein
MSLSVLAMVGLAIWIGGCRSPEAEQARQEKRQAILDRRAAARDKKAAAATRPAAAMPASSPFAKVQMGMSMKEVYDLIGQPTDTSAHITGKQFNPFYYGGDTHRVEAMYKGQGRIVFSRSSAFEGDMRVIEIIYNPDESGYN